ncbi:MAG TPA: hypothetical protein VJT31_10340 [Rugosimonospora sp.]|nr:hypothetical protein [Rugosimonospora sp.]
MSSADEAANSLQSVVDELHDALSAAQAARSQAEDGLTHAQAAGGAAFAVAFSALRDTIDGLIGQISSTVDKADEAIQEAKAVSTP